MFRKKKKNPFGRIIFLICPSKVQNLAVFSIIYIIRIRFFGPRELFQKGFRRRTWGSKDDVDSGVSARKVFSRSGKRPGMSEEVSNFIIACPSSVIRFSNPANVAKSLLDGNRDHLLAGTRSELMKQEYKVESLNTCKSELQQPTYAQRLELEDAHHGYVESRREQVRIQEELVMKEKALRDTQIRIIHEMGELKKAQELRVDEFSVQKIERKS